MTCSFTAVATSQVEVPVAWLRADALIPYMHMSYIRGRPRFATHASAYHKCAQAAVAHAAACCPSLQRAPAAMEIVIMVTRVTDIDDH